MSDISQIDGQSVRLKRESMGWAVTDMATLACLSVKQIKQIEEGGTSAFYSESVKLTAARKVAALLDMSDAQLFGQNTAETHGPDLVLPQVNAWVWVTLASATLLACGATWVREASATRDRGTFSTGIAAVVVLIVAHFTTSPDGANAWRGAAVLLVSAAVLVFVARFKRT